MNAERITLSPGTFRVVVFGRRRAPFEFRTERAAKGFMDHAVTLLGARRVQLWRAGELLEDRWAT